MISGRHPLRALKDHTRDLHQRAEHHVRILDGDATVDEYARYLAAMLGFHAPIEDRFAADPLLDAAGFAAISRRKSHFLTHDLNHIAPCAHATLRCSALPEAATLAGQLGIAYVIEGSTLGGKFILAHLPPALAPLRGTATAFLEGYGAATGAYWRRFGAIVEQVITTAEAEAEAIAGARDTFTHLITWLARYERPGQYWIAEAS
jgi:heme oxygenase (biliverdin-IX-beta and delta-forming)